MSSESSGRNRHLVLAALLIAYALNYLDRQLVGVLAGPIKADLGLSDAQLGLLGGLAFAILYSTLAVPAALLADRTSRSAVVAWAIAIWSGFTTLCGTAASFGQLFLFRIGVGVGEAGGMAPAMAIVSESFPKEQRARALSVFSIGSPLGSAAGFAIGGYLAETVSWRTTFLVVGIVGLLFVPVFRLIVREPHRAVGEVETTSARDIFGRLARKRTFWLLSVGAGIGGMPSYALLFWLPSIMQRSYGLGLAAGSQYVAGMVLVGGVIGMLAGGWLTDVHGKSDRTAYVRLPGIAFLLAAPILITGLFLNSLPFAFLSIALGVALTYAYLGPTIATVQSLVPVNMRATAPACLLLIANLIGLGLGPWLVGVMSDALTPALAAEALRYALMAAFPFYLISGILLLGAVRTLDAEAVE